MKRIKPSAIDGSVDAPASKSMMQRAVIAAALAEGETIISNPSFCGDAKATMRVVQSLGAEVQQGEDVRIKGRGIPRESTLDCGESGTCMRMITPVAAIYDIEFTITGRGTLMSRPVDMMEGPLQILGAECRSSNGLPPLKVKGPLRGGKTKIDGSKSSQHVSGLLMALPLCGKDSHIDVVNLKSWPYVELTLEVLGDFGIKITHEEMQHFDIPGNQEYKAGAYEIEGDWSAAAFLLVAGAVCGQAEVKGLRKESAQADKAIVEAIEKAGADVTQSMDSVTVRKAGLAGFEFDATDCPDLFPPLAVLACSCKGRSVIYGAERLKHKESDRAAALASELGKIGADIKINGNQMEIEGKKLVGGKVDSHNDHRIAMACAIAGLGSENGVEIEGEDCISKSYPGFFKDLESMMVEK